MFQKFRKAHPKDRDLPPRAHEIALLTSVLDGTLYDILPHTFDEEYNEAGEYVPIQKRAPSVRYSLCRTVVDDSISLLFGNGRFPEIEADSDDARAVIADLVKQTQLAHSMSEAAFFGSVGSAAVLMLVLAGVVHWVPMSTAHLVPKFDPLAPKTLISVTQRYKISRDDVAAMGYTKLAADNNDIRDWWYQRTWDDMADWQFVPIPTTADDPAKMEIDVGKSVEHNLGFCPVVWIKNLPGPSSTGTPIDGACTFRAAIDTSIEIDYQLSQVGRGLKYSSDPMLMIKDPGDLDGQSITRGGGQALTVAAGGDAKMLEINGGGSNAVIEYVRTLRELALESIHGNRASPEQLSGAASGRALELMNQGLIWLADNLRTTYGDGGVLPLIKMVALASQKMPIKVAGKIVKIDPGEQFSLRWPAWYPKTATERGQDADTVVKLVNGDVISTETATKFVARDYGVMDPSAERQTIVTDNAAAAAAFAANGAQVKVKEIAPA